MDGKRALVGGVGGLLGALVLAGCGNHDSLMSSPVVNPTPASVSISASPTTINAGQSVTLTWTASAGTSCVATGAWSGTEAASGTMTVTPTTTSGTAGFTLSCSGGGFTGNGATANVTVNAASAFSVTALVADTAGVALTTDAHLVNGWGLSIAAPPGTAPAWVANNGSQTSTLYNGNGTAIPLVVTFAAGFKPTGVLFNPSTTDFVVTGGTSAPSVFIFDGEGGMVGGWSPTVNATQTVTMYTDASAADYTGLAVAAKSGAWFLYAADFHNAKVDVFDTHFAKQATSASAFTFVDPGLPAGYAPFGIQAINNGPAGATQIYVSYAMQVGPANVVSAAGAGLGYVDIYDTNGQLIKQLVAGGWLNEPWGLALAPANFGTLSNALLVGNLGDGTIHGYDPATGTYMGAVSDSTGTAIAIPGLWGIAFGNDAQNQPDNTLFAAAGPNNYANGWYGRIDLGASAPTLGAAPVVALTVPASPLVGTVTLSATATDTLAIAKVEFWANTTLLGTVTTAPYTLSWDTTAWANGAVTLSAKAWDVNGNVGSSAATAATITN
jgi:uncharacterized protein (TIGR03118 family)